LPLIEILYHQLNRIIVSSYFMPELPEVETVRSGLDATINAKTIKNAIIRCKKLRYDIPQGLDKKLAGVTINKIDRRAKYLLIYLSNKLETNSQVLIIHLGMSGKILYKNKLPKEFEKHDHFILEFTDKSAMVFNDARRFGLIDYCPEAGLADNKHLKILGPEPLHKNFNGKYLQSFFAGKKKPIKTIIMDQNCVVGVGNIYAAESLFISNINPLQPCSEISLKKLNEFAKNIKIVLTAAIKSGGSTLRDYVRSSGDAGYFQHQFKVYGRENQPCYVCKTSIKRIVQTGRSTFYCPKCQN
jgi:formamidopyrimidine-DNA glycosylase